MSDEPRVGDDGLAGKARRIAKGAWDYARSEGTQAKIAEAKKKAVEVGGAASAGAKNVLRKTGEAATKAKEKADEFAGSEQAQRFRSGAKGLRDRIRVYEILGVPWMESPIGIGLAFLLFFPLGIYLLWRHPVLSRSRGVVVGRGAWSVLVLLVAINGDKGKESAATHHDPAQSASPAAAERLEAARTDPRPEAGRSESARTTAPGPQSKGSTGRHNGGLLTNSWDYKNGCQVLYDRSVTKAEARRLGDFLEGQGAFDGDVKTFKIDKVGNTYEFRVIIKKGLEQDSEMIEGMKQFGSELSRGVFGGAEVDVHLCDERFKTIRVVVP